MPLSNKPKIASASRAKHRQPRSSGSQPVTVENYESDALFPGIERAVASILAGGKVVAPTEVLVRMELLRAEDVEAWRFGRISFLERVIGGDLERLSRLLRVLAFHCHDLNLVATPTVYTSTGRPPHLPLRFTKNREETLEKRFPPASAATPPPRKPLSKICLTQRGVESPMVRQQLTSYTKHRTTQQPRSASPLAPSLYASAGNRSGVSVSSTMLRPTITGVSGGSKRFTKDS